MSPRTGNGRMSRTEKEDLLRLGRMHRDGAILDAKRHSAEIAADFEMRLAAEFKYDQRQIWAELMHTAQERVAELDQLLAEDCRRLGIPENFRPSINIRWYSRGENATKERRAELHRVMASRIAAIERAAIDEIERKHLEYATAVLSESLDSTQAKRLLRTLPTAKQMMPPLDYEAIRRSVLAGPEAGSLHFGLAITDETDGEDVP